MQKRHMLEETGHVYKLKDRKAVRLLLKALAKGAEIYARPPRGRGRQSITIVGRSKEDRSKRETRQQPIFGYTLVPSGRHIPPTLAQNARQAGLIERIGESEGVLIYGISAAGREFLGMPALETPIAELEATAAIFAPPADAPADLIDLTDG